MIFNSIYKDLNKDKIFSCSLRFKPSPISLVLSLKRDKNLKIIVEAPPKKIFTPGAFNPQIWNFSPRIFFTDCGAKIEPEHFLNLLTYKEKKSMLFNLDIISQGT